MRARVGRLIGFDGRADAPRPPTISRAQLPPLYFLSLLRQRAKLLKGQIPLVVVACGSLLWGGWDGPGGPAVETPGVAPSPEAPIKRRGTALAAL